MAFPLAIYASIPKSDPANPHWDGDLGTVPVVYEKPNAKWPNLDWKSNSPETYRPVFYGERPCYLWAHPIVRQPKAGENHTFIRKWVVKETEAQFDSETIPPKDLILVVSHAADDLYSMGLFLGNALNGELLNPIGANFREKNSWSSVKTFVYRANLTRTQPGTELSLVSEVANIPQPFGTPSNNPAMFTWVMQIFDYNRL